MIALRRARLCLWGSVFAALLMLGFWFPLGVLLHQRAELGVVANELGSVTTRNATLQSDITSLQSLSTVATIAHQEYDLIAPGESAYVILPAAGSTIGAPRLRTAAIPESDLVADLPAVVPHAAAVTATAPGFWGRFVNHLAFWRRG